MIKKRTYLRNPRQLIVNKEVVYSNVVIFFATVKP